VGMVGSPAAVRCDARSRGEWYGPHAPQCLGGSLRAQSDTYYRGEGASEIGRVALPCSFAGQDALTRVLAGLALS
jgi:hypothetical protein